VVADHEVMIPEHDAVMQELVIVICEHEDAIVQQAFRLADPGVMLPGHE
jgi:hypothetical protein